MLSLFNCIFKEFKLNLYEYTTIQKFGVLILFLIKMSIFI